MALDRAKRARRHRSGSNAGHALWSGIVKAEHAAGRRGSARVRRRWSRAGGCARSRADQPGYNPIGYHTGTVWPHDTAIAAAGLRRYGFDDAADTLSSGMLAAAQHFPAFRLPELFCGFDRASTGSPIAYPVACSPQAWAAGVALMLIRTMLGLAGRRAQSPAHPRSPDPARRA